jgi:hypothetical protein
MLPSVDQIAIAAYHRWLRRGGWHGHDRDDWLAAEQDLLFTLNYATIARYPLNGSAVRILGDPVQRRCRFCEQSIPPARFEGATRLVPPLLGDTTLVVGDECDACQVRFQVDLAKPFEAFARPILVGAGAGGLPRPGLSIPVPAYKFLVKTALAILPEDELPSFEETIEWVCNPNHGQDLGAIHGLSCRVYLSPHPIPSPHASLARRIEDDAPFPAMLFFVSTRHAVFQVALPLSPRDDEIDGVPVYAPPSPSFVGVGMGNGFRTGCWVDLPVSASS